MMMATPADVADFAIVVLPLGWIFRNPGPEMAL